jgi:aryl-alcohol dehydrogenase-like predicted oxidoreductase
MSIPGHAEIEATRQFALKYENQYPSIAYRTLGRTELTVSKMGFGTYRCHQNSEIHFEALKKAIEKGCNVIDTSSNYSDGFSESLIGDVLNREIVWGKLNREELLLISKVGYIQGENLSLTSKMEEEKKPFPEVVKYGDGIWHCIHPYFISDQITRTLSRMHIDELDIYLLHNPEYYLLDCQKKRIHHKTAQEEFYKRIHQAFVQLEKLVDKKLIRFYGISSNTFPMEPGRHDYVSLARIWEEYKSVCSESDMSTDEGHFAVIQFPFNWLEHQAYTSKNNLFQNEKWTVLELASNLNLGVIVNRPLNAFVNNKMYRLARYGADETTDYSIIFYEEISRLQELENSLQEIIQNHNANIKINDDVDLKSVFQNAETLKKMHLQSPDISSLSNLVNYYFLPLFKIGEKTLLEKMEMNREKVKALIEGYFRQFNRVALSIRNQADKQNYLDLKPLEERFNQVNKPIADKLSFSQKAVQVASGNDGIQVVLNGMRTPTYVDDAMATMSVDRVDIKGLFR